MPILRPLFYAAFFASTSVAQETRQATGVKIGEVTENTAIIWVRLTAHAKRNDQGYEVPDKTNRAQSPKVPVEDLKGACPGAAGKVRVRYGPGEGLSHARATEWATVDVGTGFVHQFRLTDLRPATTYHFVSETAEKRGGLMHGAFRGRFQTAPPSDRAANVTFAVITGMMYKDLDHADGFHIFPAMLKLKPHFIVPTGDTVYYDNDDLLANTPELARHHWHRMYSLPRLIEFHRQVPGYWEKDDHDTWVNDCWPSMKSPMMLPLTFKDGLRIFREQTPMGKRTYRTFRWGKDLQIWLVEGRDFRSPNTAPDGPHKTIWGTEQKRWLKRSILASTATWKVMISPTPIVGPDRRNKGDNHANARFAHEGNEIRKWIQQNAADNLFVVCGDRHWQYHSIHPATRVKEFSCGPASDQHAGGSPGKNPTYHRFHRVKGGFLSVVVTRKEGNGTITFRFHDVHGRVVYKYKESHKV